METAILTGIQRFSLHDGPGIRTTVFFQGCNMRCAWCHNPETFALSPQPMLYTLKCIGCGQCYKVCPTGAHQIVDGRHVIDRTLCTGCGACADACFSGAIEMTGHAYSVEQVMREILQDRLYYEESGGGVTFSGGECTLQSEFIVRLAEACRAEGIHTALETNLFLPFDRLKPILAQMDLIMFDIKLFSDTEHQQYTKVSNAPVFENAQKADGLGIPMIARTPLIPGATDTKGNIQAILDYLTTLHNVQLYELLNFNPLGGGKSDALGMDNPFACVKPLGADELNALKQSLRIPDGFPVRIR